MQSLSKMVKCCGTCSYWMGARSIDPSNNWVMVEGNIDGKCGNPRGNRIATWKAITGICSLFQKWNALR